MGTHDGVHRGMIVFKWHDTRAFGMTQMYAEVIRVNRVTVTVEWLRSGIRQRLPFGDLHPTHPDERADILAAEDRRMQVIDRNPYAYVEIEDA